MPFLGCNNRRMEIDHTNEFAKTKHTTTDELAKPCTHCHDLRTNHGYTYGPIDPLTGKRPLYPPNRAGP